MIEQLHIKGLKSHANTVLPLSNLTVLTGLNGCGKTSALQALLLLRQSFLKGRLTHGLELNKPLCEIGTAHDALYRNADDGHITFQLQMAQETLVFDFLADERKLSDSFVYASSPESIPQHAMLAPHALFNTNFQYISALRWGGRSRFPQDTFAVETQRQLSNELGQGEYVAHYLHKFGGDLVCNHTDIPDLACDLLTQVTYWEQCISPSLNLDVQSEQDRSYQITYGEHGISGIRAENVGFGVSYTLPVIVALASAQPGSLLLIENPEAHLHPEGQASLAKLIARVAQSGVQIMVETHSDHLINGILVACRRFERDEKGIDRHLVSLCYMGEKDERQATQLQHIPIEADGKLAFQPKGFFDRSEHDLFYLSGLSD